MGYASAVRYVAALALILLPVRATPALAKTGNELLTECEKFDDWLRSGICLGYIQGVEDGANAQAVVTGSRKLFCVRDGVTLGQLKDVVVSHLKSNPANRDTFAEVLVIVAFKDAFPCPQK